MKTLIRESWARARSSPSLRLSLAAWMVFGLAGSEALTLALAGAAHQRPGPLVLQNALAWLVACAGLFGGAALLKTPDGTEVNRVGIPNGLTLIRVWACYPLMLCAVLPLAGNDGFWFWVAVGAPVGYLDVIDGIVARTAGPVTVLGKALDPAVDAIFFSCGIVGAAALRVVSPWITALVLLRYLGPFVLTPVVLARGRRPELVHTSWGRHSTLFVGWIALACTIVRATGHDAVATSLLLGIPLLVPTTLLHFGALWKRVKDAPVAHSGRQ